MPHRDLLFEVGTEELPPSELGRALQNYLQEAGRQFAEARLEVLSGFSAYSTPRRLTLGVRGLAERQSDLVREVIGPARTVAYTKDGRSTRAAEGFARAQGISVGDLVVTRMERGEYVAARVREAGRNTVEVLLELLPRIPLSIPWRKQMRWDETDLRFVRPIRWMVCLYGTEVVPVRIGSTVASDLTYGHRFLDPGPHRLVEASAYLAVLREARVEPEVQLRRERIRKAVEQEAAREGGIAVIEEPLLEAVADLVEWPAAITGSFPSEYLDLPREVIITPMQHHQRYFPIEHPVDRTLLPRFVAISNMDVADPAVIRSGYERVLRARLADAAFYFRHDLAVTLEARLPQLEQVVYQERLGTLAEKARRLVALGRWVAGRVRPELVDVVARAALLAKADLVTGMVREFPELEGVMGGEYARRGGEPDSVARAIREHYLPRFAGDRLPHSLPGAIVSLVDRIDAVVGCLGVGVIPTGSEDPYGLRRRAAGAVAILLDVPIRVSLTSLVDQTLDGFGGALTESKTVTRDRAIEFLRGRLSTGLQERGMPADVVEAVLATGVDDPAAALGRAQAVAAFRARPDFESLLIAFKRVVNILPAGFAGSVDAARFQDPAERALFEALAQRRGRIEDALRDEAYETALAEIAALRPWVDQFFTAVLVMVEDQALQQNRLALLADIARLLLPVADLRRLAG